MGSTDKTLEVVVRFAEVGAGTDQVWYQAIRGLDDFKVVEAYFVSDTNRTADNTNYTDLSVELDGTEIASEQTTVTDTGNLTAGTAIELALTADGKDLEGSAGSVLTVKKTDNMGGLALDGCVTVLLEETRK